MRKVVLLHTNDIHSHFEQMPKIAEVIRQRKAANQADHVLTIDCGDHMDRARMETEGSEGMANIDVMNATGYDYAVLGNNEGLTFTPDMLQQLYSQADFTVLGSNMVEQLTDMTPPWLKIHDIVSKDGIRIGLIGLTVPFTAFYELLGWQLLSPFQTAATIVDRLRPQVDVLIVISHLGVMNDEKLAQEIEGIDIILGAHTHHLFEQPVLMNGTYLCAAGKFGQHVGEVELFFDQYKQLTHVSGRCIDVNSYSDHPQIDELIEEHKLKCTVNLNEPVTILKESLTVDLQRETRLGNMMAAGLRKWTNAEIGLVNSGQMLQGLPRGVVTKGDLHKLCPSPVNPCKMLLRGEHLWKALEEALITEFQQKEIRGFGFRGERLGILCLDGLRIEYSDKAKNYQKIEQIIVNGIPLDLGKDYSVGTIDMFTFGVGYTSIREGHQVEFFLPEFLRDVLYHELRDESAIHLGKNKHWIEH